MDWASRLGKALASAIMGADPKPTEWMTGTPLSATAIRELQGLRKLDRHHVFPKKVLVDEKVDDKMIQHGLNGVVLDQRTNLRLWKIPPQEYVTKMLKETKVGEKELKERIESHMVPFEELKSTKGSMKKRYQNFLEKRAKLMAQQIERLATLK